MTDTTLATFGDGWMTRAARDLCRIMFVFGGVDPTELMKELGKQRFTGRYVNTSSVAAALARIRTNRKETK